MTKTIWGAALVAFVVVAGAPEPASAQYRFNPRVDPSQCHWTEICDYGGRAYRASRAYKVRALAPRCRMVTVNEVGPGGVMVTRTVRRCPLSVRG
jgi:hypothetical protein